MPTRIAVASGKGGTGKTSVAVSLFLYFNQTGKSTLLVDCDVEEPNDHLFFDSPAVRKKNTVNQEIPVIDTSSCTFCRKCAEYCEFNAILVIPPIGFAEVNPDLCHSCNACLVACEHEAIWIRKDPIGEIKKYSNGIGPGMIEGNLKIGSTMQTLVIRDLIKSLHPSNDFLILDSPPGTSCPVVETISDADFVVLVTEPTPFGLHDLKIMVDLCRLLSLPFGVIINKSGLGNREVYSYLQDEGIGLLGEIPFDRDYARLYAEGRIVTAAIPRHIEDAYLRILEDLKQRLPAA